MSLVHPAQENSLNRGKPLKHVSLQKLYSYLRNERFHVEEIQNVSRCTTAFLVAFNLSSRPSKEKLAQILLTYSCMYSVVRVWPDYTCTYHAQFILNEPQEVDDRAYKVSFDTVL